MREHRAKGSRRAGTAVLGIALMAWASLAPAAVKGSTSPGVTQPAPVLTPKSNVLLIIGDDMGVELFSTYANYFNSTSQTADDIGIISMPQTTNIAKLAAAGVTFVNAWSSPVCSPTRAGIFTGLYSRNNHVYNVIDGQIDAAGTLQDDLDPALTTIPEVISDAGYASGLFGKWHLGQDYHPEDHGWQMFSGVLGGGLDDYFEWDKRVEQSGQSPQIYNYNGDDEDYATFVNVDDAATWINSQTGNWMATVAFNAAHKRTGADNYTTDDDPPNLRGCSPSSWPHLEIDIFHKMIECMDIEIGDLLTQINGKLSNTTIIFVGDNGTETDVSDFTLFEPHGKGTVYESGVAVPMIIADGNAYKGNGTGTGTGRVVSPGRFSTALVQTVDIFDTVVEITGMTRYTDDSYSQVPILRNSQNNVRPNSFDEMMAFDRDVVEFAARSPIDKLIWIDSTSTFPALTSGTCELYNLSKDRWEQTLVTGSTLANKRQTLLDQIKAKLGLELTCSN